MKDRDSQVGGTHYARRGIQPFDIYDDEYTPQELAAVLHSHVIRYALRWRDKNGKQDLMKALDYLQQLITLVEDFPSLAQRGPNDRSVRELHKLWGDEKP